MPFPHSWDHLNGIINVRAFSAVTFPCKYNFFTYCLPISTPLAITQPLPHVFLYCMIFIIVIILIVVMFLITISISILNRYIFSLIFHHTVGWKPFPSLFFLYVHASSFAPLPRSITLGSIHLTRGVLDRKNDH